MPVELLRQAARRLRDVGLGLSGAFALSILLLMFLHAGSRFGLGRWWEAHTPALIH